jgi:hypothetical protein
MSNKTTIGIIGVLVVILGLAWWSLSNKGEEVAPPGDQSEQVASPPAVTVNHYFDNGSHSLEGTLTLPTPCHTLSYTVDIAKSLPEQVTVHFVTKPGEGLCTQVLSDKFFRVVFNASADASISATLDGKPIRLIFSDTKEGITK